MRPLQKNHKRSAVAKIILLSVFSLITFSVSAQKTVHTDYSNQALAGVLLAKNVPNKPGQSVTMLDTISDYRMSADTAMFYLGKGDPDNRVVVLIPRYNRMYKKQQGNKWIGKPLFVRGTVSAYNDRPAVIVKDRNQIQVIDKVKVKHQ